MILWHGTSEKRAKSALRLGLKLPFLTTDKWVRMWFAMKASDEDDSIPVLLKVRVPDQSKLRPDENMYEEPISTVIQRHTTKDPAQVSNSDWYRMIDSGLVPYPKNDFDWKTSLDAVASVWYDGTISARDILEVKIPRR